MNDHDAIHAEAMHDYFDDPPAPEVDALVCECSARVLAEDDGCPRCYRSPAPPTPRRHA